MGNSVEITRDDFIIEIGPGLGTLTKRLIERAGEVIAIELDTRMIKILENRFKNCENFSIINNDILQVDLKSIIEEKRKKYNNVKVVANLPYYITTPIIMKLLEEKLEIDSITVMVQKEVADRITAIPGKKNSGAITYSVYYYSIPSKIVFVPKQCFIPSPEVDSEVIQLKIRKEPCINVKDENLFFKIVKSSFMQRRKTLINGLVNSNIIKSKEEAIEILEKLNLEKNIRGDILSIEEFAKITNMLS